MASNWGQDSNIVCTSYNNMHESNTTCTSLGTNESGWGKESNTVKSTSETSKLSLNNSWNSRYNRSHMNWRRTWEEDMKIFEEHFEYAQKKTAFLQEFLEGTKVRVLFQNQPIDLPSDIKTFNDLNLENQLKSNLLQMEFKQMTPIQRAVIPYIIENKDIIGCAQTGSGKTVAFLAPIVNKMILSGPPSSDTNLPKYVSAPLALILTPTRELAEQIFKETRKLIHKTGMIVAKAYGGVPTGTQLYSLSLGCDLLVATPGRLIDFIKWKRVTLASVKYLVLDEADRMLEMGFEPQLKEIFFQNDLSPATSRINMMFSATFTAQVKSIARNFMNEFYFFTTNIDEENNANINIKQNLIYVQENEKMLKLHEILPTLKGSVIIFMETKMGVDFLYDFLTERNYKCVPIHGDKTQDRRQIAITSFSKGEVPILIATAVASRGLDYPNVPYVFNFDLPKNIEDYIHRIGRTGRCGNKGVSISFVTDTCQITGDLCKLLTKCNQEVPDWLLSLSNGSYHQTNFNSISKYRYGNGIGSGTNRGNSYREQSNYVSSTSEGLYQNGENLKPSESNSNKNQYSFGEQGHSNRNYNKPIKENPGGYRDNSENRENRNPNRVGQDGYGGNSRDGYRVESRVSYHGNSSDRYLGDSQGQYPHHIHDGHIGHSQGQNEATNRNEFGHDSRHVNLGNSRVSHPSHSSDTNVGDSQGQYPYHIHDGYRGHSQGQYKGTNQNGFGYDSRDVYRGNSRVCVHGNSSDGYGGNSRGGYHGITRDGHGAHSQFQFEFNSRDGYRGYSQSQYEDNNRNGFRYYSQDSNRGNSRGFYHGDDSRGGYHGYIHDVYRDHSQGLHEGTNRNGFGYDSRDGIRGDSIDFYHGNNLGGYGGDSRGGYHGNTRIGLGGPTQGHYEGTYRNGFGNDSREDLRCGYRSDSRGGYIGDLRTDTNGEYGGNSRGGYGPDSISGSRKEPGSYSQNDSKGGYQVDSRDGYQGNSRNGYRVDSRDGYNQGDSNLNSWSTSSKVNHTNDNQSGTSSNKGWKSNTQEATTLGAQVQSSWGAQDATTNVKTATAWGSQEASNW